MGLVGIFPQMGGGGKWTLSRAFKADREAKRYFLHTPDQTAGRNPVLLRGAESHYPSTQVRWLRIKSSYEEQYGRPVVN